MKKIFLIMALVCACSAAFISCEKDGNSPSNSDNSSITCTPTIIKDDGNGNDYQVTLQSKASWSATVDKKWVSVSPTSGEGDAFVTITIANGSADSARIMFSNSSSSTIVTVYRAIIKPGEGGSDSETHNNHTYIDLGLSVKWANMNVGATTVTGYGDYFAWGETSPKTDYSWSTYKYCNGSSSTMTKYCVSSSYGTVDNKTTLEAEDDAAHVYWGGNWRIPTLAEQQELYDNCTITWTSDYKSTGVAGRIFTSNKTGYTDKSIFLPAAGYRFDTGLYGAGPYYDGHYWSSSINHSYDAWSLYFHSVSVDTFRDYRYYGQSIRAVCP